MSRSDHPLRALLVGLLLAAPAVAQEATPPASAEPAAPATEAAEPAAEEPTDIRASDVIVVTASRTEQQLHDAPATMTVLTAQDISAIPADDAGDLLRNVPGLNVAQMSARDVQIGGREATNSLATGQLVLLDGRSLYLDFFGFVAWDFVPVDFGELKQVEVVRGPGSAVWGANAFSGVINLISKSPKEMVGTGVTLGGGELGTLYGGVTHAGVSGKVGYKLSASYFEQDAYERPVGFPDGTPFPPQGQGFADDENEGTQQPKADVRIDYDVDESSVLSFGVGYAGTDGIIHSGIGPFDMKKNTSLSFAKADYNRLGLRLGLFYNKLDGEARNLLTVGPTGQPINFIFKTDTYNLEFGNFNAISDNFWITYGANYRQNEFDLSIAPAADDRQEYGAYLQAELTFAEKWRWVVGGRWDDLDPIGSVFSPRTALIFNASNDHTFRLSYGRAFRAPAVVQNYLDTTIIAAAIPPLVPGAPPLPIITQVHGNEDLEEEKTDSIDLGYIGTFGATTVTASVYHNEQEDLIDFFQSVTYSPTNPPPGWFYPVIFLAVPPLNALPAEFSYRNLGKIENEGLELGINWRKGKWSTFFNYSYQKEPDIEGFLPEELGQPPEHRANFGFGWDHGPVFVNANVNYQDDAYFADVLSIRGTTDSYTMLNTTIGFRFFDERATFSIIGQNITDERVQQHIFGDIISRKVSGQLKFRF
jgi:outer membrane receptor protein involved in Fe transport